MKKRFVPAALVALGLVWSYGRAMQRATRGSL